MDCKRKLRSASSRRPCSREPSRPLSTDFFEVAHGDGAVLGHGLGDLVGASAGGTGIDHFVDYAEIQGFGGVQLSAGEQHLVGS